jgi:glutathione-regulated potassium-efflux system protein KefB
VDTFKEQDEARLYEDYAHYTDTQKMAALAMQRSEELAQILAQDWEIVAAEKTKRLDDKRKAELKVALPIAGEKPPPAPPKEPLRKSG